MTIFRRTLLGCQSQDLHSIWLYHCINLDARDRWASCAQVNRITDHGHTIWDVIVCCRRIVHLRPWPDLHAVLLIEGASLQLSHPKAPTVGAKARDPHDHQRETNGIMRVKRWLGQKLRSIFIPKTREACNGWLQIWRTGAVKNQGNDRGYKGCHHISQVLREDDKEASGKRWAFCLT